MNKLFFPLFLLISVVWSGFSAHAQQAFSLQECVQYAGEQDILMQNYSKDQLISQQTLRQSRSKYLPQVSAVGDFRDNLQLQTSILPFNPDPTGVRGPTPVRFGTTYNTTLALDASLVLFDPTLRNTLRSQEINTQIAENNYAQRNLEVVVNLKKAYYAALINRQKISYNQTKLARLRKLLEDAQVRLETEQLQAIEVRRQEWDLKTQEIEIERLQVLYDQSLLQVKFWMGYPLEQPISLKDSLPQQLRLEQNAEIDWNNRYDLKNLEAQRMQNNLEVQKYKRQYLPTVTLYGYLGTQAFQNNFAQAFQTWFPLSYVGLRVNVPIFDGLSKNYQIQGAKIQTEKKENEIKQLQRQAVYDNQLSQTNIQNLIKTLSIRQNALAFAEENVQYVLNRYEAGLVLYREVVDAEVKITEAQNAYLQTYQDLVNAYWDGQKVRGETEK
ncbi:MAG TPA: hypothetical protein DCM08_01770 [Microscillaceae bacterium]|nr:hypothetical protein [Microscillaceae bacterium]